MTQEKTGQPNYYLLNAERAMQWGNVRGARILVVVGVNTGSDCRYFVEWGDHEIHGVDVVSDVAGTIAIKR